MRIDASATAITWLLFVRSTGSTSFRSPSFQAQGHHKEKV
jgi:hypothetical protein